MAVLLAFCYRVALMSVLMKKLAFLAEKPLE